jgi:hypothetical protein
MNCSRRAGSTLLAAIFVLAVALHAQDKAAEWKSSSDPETLEQVAVYKAVLARVLKDYAETAAFLADKTTSLKGSGTPSIGSCQKELDLSNNEDLPTANRQINPAVARDLRVVLVDSQWQMKTFAPERQAFRSFYTLSNIMFDKNHRQALVEYNLHCGSDCGGGATLLLKKAGRKWVIGQNCGAWGRTD